MMSASEGRGSWKSGHSKGGCRNLGRIVQISSKCGQVGFKNPKFYVDIINGSPLCTYNTMEILRLSPTQSFSS